MVQDGRSISSGADSDDSSGPDSPQPPSGSATSHLIMEPEGLLGLSPPSSTTSSMPQRQLQPPELNGAGTGGGSSGCGGGGGCPSTSGGTSSNTNNNSNNNINNGKLIKSATANAAPTMIATSATVASPLGAGVSGGGPGTAVSATAAAGGPGGGGGGGGSSNVNSVLYPAAALANLPHDVLLSLMQSGHLQLHSNEGGFLWVSEQTEMGGKLIERERERSATVLPSAGEWFCVQRIANLLLYSI